MTVDEALERGRSLRGEEGFDSSGRWLSIRRPLDTNLSATFVVIGAVVGGAILVRCALRAPSAWSRHGRATTPQ